ncbi:MAG TPA: nucleoside deaminase [Burkholderiales bacterium]|nr:nucleoside deaminase [Burkholderiales bacterium]
MPLDHDRYMLLALDLAREAAAAGNRPLGSLLVSSGGEIVSRGTNRVYTDSDPTSHGEMMVIRDACARRKTLDLSDLTLYTTLEPCPMCCYAILEAQVGGLVLGARHAAIGRTDLGSYSVETFFAMIGRSVPVVTGVRAQECVDIRLAWIAERAHRGLGPR